MIKNLTIEKLTTPKMLIRIGVGLIAFILLFNTFYTVNEGHMGIKKQFSKAISQHEPGLHAKIPFIQSITEIEVRTRKNQETMPTSTHEQMPVKAIVSVNWTVDKKAALNLYKKYGGLDQFESRILDPRFKSATKDAIPHFKAEQLIQDRATAIALIERKLLVEMDGFPVSIDNVQIENIVLPKKYIRSIETKQTEKNLADAEKHKLARQQLEAQREVNIAQAKADGIDAVSKAEANAIRVKGLAEAETIKAKAQALKNNPLIIKLTEAQNWDGQLPQTILGNGAMPIMDMRPIQKGAR